MLIVILAICGWFGHFAYLRITRRPTPRPEYWEAMLAALDPPPPGAIPGSQALDLLRSCDWEADPAVASVPNFDISEILSGAWDEGRSDIQAAGAVFQSPKYQEAVTALRQGLARGWQDAVPLAADAFLVGYASYRHWARWLVAHSRWAREHDHDLSTAVEDWLTAFRLGRQVRRQQLAIASLVETAMNLFAAREMMCASRERLGLIDTRSLALEVDGILGPVPTPRQLLEGDRICAHSFLEYWYVREGGDWMAVDEMVGLQRWTGTPVSRIWNLASPLFHDLPTARATVDNGVASLDTCVDLARCQSQRGDGGWNVLIGFWFPVKTGRGAQGFARILTLCYAGRCGVDAALTTLALHEYHRRNGRYPATLEELLPDFLPRLPVDYGDRQPLRYRLTADGYVLYSIGINGWDDGGKAGPYYPEGFRENNPDTVFSAVKRPEVQR